MTAKPPARKPCGVAACPNDALPNKSWCREHTDLFAQIGRTAVEPDIPHVPSYLQSFVRKPEESVMARSSPVPITRTPAPAARKPRARYDAIPVPAVEVTTPPVKQCVEKGCTEARYKSYNRCFKHARAYWGKYNKKVAPASEPAPEAALPPDLYPSRRWCSGCHRLLTIGHFDTSRETPRGPLNFTCRTCAAD